MPLSEFKKSVLGVVKNIPSGETFSYGKVAELSGNPGAARAVGTLMKENYDESIPCHRVVKSNGELGEYNRNKIRKEFLLLQEEAISPETHSKIIPHWIEKDIVLIDKPLHISSFKVVSILRKLLDLKKIGHAGTLDPLASGLMILGITKSGTKKMEQYLKLPKTYTAHILLGAQTDTGDLEGNIINTADGEEVSSISKEDIEKATKNLLGSHMFSVPMYSAIKVDGKPLYWYARNNKQPAHIPEKPMIVTDIELLPEPEQIIPNHQQRHGDFDAFVKNKKAFKIISLSLTVESGTYIRTLAEYFGRTLDIPATLCLLRRTHIKNWSVDKAYDLQPHITDKETFSKSTLQ